mmetsp:Transcript_8105/g.17726  ORF Transcript_8105/g.17726 Transcript_8105/m.17726 type:complete len:338 (-) Transcript_8105:214-1227(-)
MVVGALPRPLLSTLHKLPTLPTPLLIPLPTPLPTPLATPLATPLPPPPTLPHTGAAGRASEGAVRRGRGRAGDGGRAGGTDPYCCCCCCCPCPSGAGADTEASASDPATGAGACVGACVDVCVGGDGGAALSRPGMSGTKARPPEQIMHFRKTSLVPLTIIELCESNTPLPMYTSTPSALSLEAASKALMSALILRMRRITAAKSTSTPPTFTPYLCAVRACWATEAHFSRALEGTHPKLVQSPPMSRISTTATLAPMLRAPREDTRPPAPQPSTSRLYTPPATGSTHPLGCTLRRRRRLWQSRGGTPSSAVSCTSCCCACVCACTCCCVSLLNAIS